MKITREKMLAMYRKMLLSRRVDERIIDLYRAGLPGMIHLSLGQEATTVGACEALEKDDFILSTHRGKGHYIAKGGNLNALMAELMGKQTGSNKGKGGPMHIMDSSVGMLGANGIVGSSLPIACGTALASVFLKDRKVTVGFFGDGAANCGPCHESMNLAAIWNLPVIFVCENNCYQVTCHADCHSSIADYYRRAESYGIPGYSVDGMNVTEVYEVTRLAVDRARRGEGPSLVECKTYRFRGHAESDPTCGMAYRTKEELEKWQEKCPIKQAKADILKKDWASEQDLEGIDSECKQKIEAALEFAKSSLEAPPEWALTDVYA